MVIWPEKVVTGDEGWDNACALMRVLALDPRRRNRKSISYFETADDFLDRPKIWVDRRHVLAPYFSYTLRFNVSASVHGSIPVDDSEQLEEFRRQVGASLLSDLTVAERARWEADRHFRESCRSGDPLAAVYSSVAGEESRKADRYYHEVRDAIEEPRRFDGIARCSLSSHKEVLEGLLRLGTTLQIAA